MTLLSLRGEMRSLALNYRGTLRFVLSDNFALAYESSTKFERVTLRAMVLRGDRDAVKVFVRRKLDKLTSFHNMTMPRLRNIACRLQIERYWLKSKTTLLEEIDSALKRLKKSSE